MASEPTTPDKRIRQLERQVRALKKAADPFVRVYRINLPISDGWPDDTPVRSIIPGVWPTWGELKALVEASQ